ncbi:hypothetical protein BJF78_21160 [Pseudonocardia sp. CNS-139]|nr:hypothetical protein BJF78_21160 [Pseudonocardia sp. CNS-139]
MRSGGLRRHRGFRRFWLAATVSGLGSQITYVALGVLVVVDLGGSAADVGLVQGATVLPYLAVGLFAGVVADRVRRKPLLVGTDVARAVVLGCVPLLALGGVLDVPALAALMLGFGIFDVLNAAAHQSFLPRLLPRGLLHRANVRLEQSNAATTTGGRLLGGGLVAAAGAPLALLADAVSYAVSALLTATVPLDDPRPERASRSVLADLAEGARWVYRHRTLGPLAIGTHGWFLANSVAMVAYVPFALVELGIGPVGLGVTYALAGIGGLAGSTASEPLARRSACPRRWWARGCWRRAGSASWRSRPPRTGSPRSPSPRRASSSTESGSARRPDRDGLPPDRHARPAPGPHERDDALVQPGRDRRRRPAGRVLRGRRRPGHGAVDRGGRDRAGRAAAGRVRVPGGPLPGRVRERARLVPRPGRFGRESADPGTRRQGADRASYRAYSARSATLRLPTPPASHPPAAGGWAVEFGAEPLRTGH